MAVLTEDMTRLRDEIEILRGTRSSFIRNLKRDVGEMKADFRKERMEMGRETRDELMTFVSDLKGDVFQMQDDFRKANIERAEKTRDELNDFRKTRSEGAKKTRNELMTFVSDLKGDVFQMQEDFRKANADRKATVADMLQGFSSDLEGARSAWFGTTNIEHKVSEKPKQKAIKKEALSETKPEVTKEAPVREHIPDDLTVIKGIGTGMQKRLNEVGIYTYSQIAESTPESLIKVLGKKFSQLAADVEKWIEQAKNLAK